MNYIVYDKSTGFILRTGTCPADDLERQARYGEAAMEGQAHDELHMVVAGAIVERPEHLRAKREPTYAELRKYPPIGDQLDAIWKGGAALDEMRARVQAVKNEFPKGQS